MFGLLYQRHCRLEKDWLNWAFVTLTDILQCGAVSLMTPSSSNASTIPVFVEVFLGVGKGTRSSIALLKRIHISYRGSIFRKIVLLAAVAGAT